MTVEAYRITKTKHLSAAFDGEGARRYGGRWNSIGVRMVYTASSLSLATLELLVHIEDISTIEGLFSVVPIEFDDTLVTKIDVSDIPKGWNNPEPISGTQTLGGDWARGQESAILKVPSAVTPSEYNFLLNPLHHDFPDIKQGDAFAFTLDTRLT